MKKPITIGVIAVIATILVTSAVDFSAIGAKPVDQIHLETSGGLPEGLIFCPNGDSIDTEQGHMSFTEHDTEDFRGQFFQSKFENISQKQFQAWIWGGEVQSNKFTLTGIGQSNDQLANLCGETPFERTIVTIWGICGQNETIHFESENGYHGSFTNNVLCV